MEIEAHLITIVVFFAIAAGHILVHSNYAETTSVWVLSGKRAELPCQPKPKLAHDKPVLVLWYRTSSDRVPIYSFDATESEFPDGVRWEDKAVLGSRAYFRALSNPPALILEPTHGYDQGVYRCRVDYRISASTSSFVNLTVVVPPGVPMVLWKGQSVAGGVGPVLEGERAMLTCRSSGGRPSPTMTWYMEARPLPLFSANSTFDIVSGTYTAEATVSLLITRSLQSKQLSCHAIVPREPNTKTGVTDISPRTTSVTLNITLPPTKVQIMSSGGGSQAGTTLRLACQAVGSHPPAELTWWRAHTPLSQVTYSIDGGGNISTATLTILLNRHHDGTQLSCTAANPALRHPPLTDTIKLIVFYAPVVTLSFGDVVKPELIKEGDDVFFQCNIEANPQYHQVVWHHNGVELMHNMSAGITMHGDNLIMRRLRRKDSGSFTCTAANTEGRVTSNAVHLAVRHKPFCARGGREHTQGTARGSTVAVKCLVEAEPSHGIIWTWKRKRMDGSEEEIPQELIINDGTSSSVLVTPRTPEEYGRFLCRAANSVGEQDVDCVVNLVPAGPPDTPANCSVTHDKPATPPDTASLSITCVEGFDGGLPQQFQLEVRQEGKLVANITNKFPEWGVSELKSGVMVKLKIIAHNARGRSEPQILQVHTLNAQQRAAAAAAKAAAAAAAAAGGGQPTTSLSSSQSNSTDTAFLTPIVGAGLGLVIVVLLLVIIIIIVCRRKWPREKKASTVEVPLTPTAGSDNYDPDVVASIQRAPQYSIDVIPADQVGCMDEQTYECQALQEQDEGSHTPRRACVYVHRDTHSTDCDDECGSCTFCAHRPRDRLTHHVSLQHNTDREDVAINDSQSYDSGVSESESDSELKDQEMGVGGQGGAMMIPENRTYSTMSPGSDALTHLSPHHQLCISSDLAGVLCPIEKETIEPSPLDVRLRPFVSKDYKVSPDSVDEMRFIPSSCRELRLLPSVSMHRTRTPLLDMPSPSRDLSSSIGTSVSSRPLSSCSVTSPQREIICLPISPGESPRPYIASGRSRDSSREPKHRTPVPHLVPQTSKPVRPISTRDVSYEQIPVSADLNEQDEGEPVTLLQSEYGDIVLIPRRTSKPDIRGKHCTPVYPSVKVSELRKHSTSPPTHSITLPKAVARESKSKKLKRTTEMEKLSNESNCMLPTTPLLTPEEKTVILSVGQGGRNFHTKPNPDVCRCESSV